MAVIEVAYHQFWLLDEGCRPDPQTPVGNGLAGVAGLGVVKVWTGIATGPATVSLRALTAGPPPDEAAEWDDVVELSLAAPTGAVRAMALMADPPAELGPLTTAGPGPYRLRVHVRGRDSAPDESVSAPVEDYLLVAWPAPDEPERILRQTDSYGAQVRRSEAAAPPSPSPSPARIDALREQRRRALRGLR
ncbi:hypothetical protein BJY16_005575 [Actinoplanes octamycinicus]|uniref:Uncharacterized protein n=1 Tax=Actinoplanes octamycinicus TaxID=135948 RepID=A0A7W7H180_9ACTN|nr:hypothetical protein [Actinoplanes octamycinicus]MBB4742116.1 hypothetical protein [Actinoplanes octamycinicus]GIE60038.1 hypothetical protein Aoc01nite_54400 [Actinoplanes octamycinicus]